MTSRSQRFCATKCVFWQKLFSSVLSASPQQCPPCGDSVIQAALMWLCVHKTGVAPDHSCRQSGTGFVCFFHQFSIEFTCVIFAHVSIRQNYHVSPSNYKRLDKWRL